MTRHSCRVLCGLAQFAVQLVQPPGGEDEVPNSSLIKTLLPTFARGLQRNRKTGALTGNVGASGEQENGKKTRKVV